MGKGLILPAVGLESCSCPLCSKTNTKFLPCQGNAKPAQELAYLQLGLLRGCGVGAITQLIVST